MAQRYDIVTINFQANARNANAAIQSIQAQAEKSRKEVNDLKKKLDSLQKGPSPASSSMLNKIRADIKAKDKEAKQWEKAYQELAKGMRTLDQAVKAFNDGSLKEMSAAFQKSAYNAAKLVRSKLDPVSDSYKKDKQELTALMDAAQQNFARLQADTQQVLDTIAKGGKVSRQAVQEELKQQQELLLVLSEKDKGYKAVQRSAIELDYELRKMGGSWDYIRKNISNTKKVSDETLRAMYQEALQVNKEGRVYATNMRENNKVMRESRDELNKRVTGVLGGDLGKQSQESIKNAIANARFLVDVYGSASKKARDLSVLIVNAEAHLKTVGVEGARAARQQEEEARKATDTLKLMQDRMVNVGKLSQSAFTETRKFWQEQYDGANKGSKAYKEAEKNLKTLAAEQKRVADEALQKSAKNLSSKDFSRISQDELQASVDAGKKIALGMKPGTDAYNQLVDNIVRAEKYIKQFGLEGQRSSRQAAEQMAQMNGRMSDLSKLSDGALEETKKFWAAQMDGAERGSKAYREFENNYNRIIESQRKRVTEQNRLSANTLMKGDVQLKMMGEGEIRKAIDAAREYQKTLVADSKAYTDLSGAIYNAEQYLAKYGFEADKAALKEKELKTEMTDRLTKLMSLSDSALAETKKFWQAQQNGAKRTSDAYKEAEANVKSIAEVERQHKAEQATAVGKKPYNYSDAEIRQAVSALNELRDTQQRGSDAWKEYNNLAEQGQKYLDNIAQSDKTAKFNALMEKLPELSSAALSETKKFWEAMVAGADKGSQAMELYQSRLKETTEEEKSRQIEADKKAVKRIDSLEGEDLKTLSEADIRESIAAGERLIKTYQSASPEAHRLAENIVEAEEHLKKYGLEAERAASRESAAIEKAEQTRKEADSLMQEQLWPVDPSTGPLSESALKAQEQFWRRRIDDPKTASESLKQYNENLKETHRLQAQMIEDKGNDALEFFRNGDVENASADQLRQQSDALKQYRDSLPKRDNADLILEINGYLSQTGQVASGSASQLMSLQDALQVGKMGLNNTFKGSAEQLQQAKKVLEEAFAHANKGTAEYNQLREALDGVALEEKRVGSISAELDAILSHPKGKSFNELKVAVEQARKQLNGMRRETKEQQEAYDQFAEKIRNADLELKNLGNTSKGTQNSFKKAVSRLKTYITLYMGTAVAIQKLSSAMGDMMTLSDKMGEVRKTTGFTAEQVGKLSDNLQKMDTRTPIQNLMELSAAAGQLGLNTEEDVRGFTEAANEMLVALPELGQDGATEMMKIAIATGEVNKIKAQMEKGTIQGSSATAVAMEKVASTIDRLRATTAAAAPPVADFVKRVGAVGAQSGISIDQVAALGATVDELGMGTEMAATALSRMIPAIKQNAFSIAQAIGVKPETITQLYETGHAMDVILMILKHIKESNLNPDGVEKLLGTGGMADVMKELNQQGARAGIVFAGLSQNVEELERNLGTAKNAYQEGTAIMDEYNKMNDTTAAKWERLKNQIQEVIVNNSTQSTLGWIIDRLRWIVDILTGNNGVGVALRVIIGYLFLTKLHVGGIVTGLVHLRTSLTTIGVALGILDKESKSLMLSNVLTAAALAAIYLIYEISNLTTAVGEANKALGKTRDEIDRAEARFEGYWKTLEKTNETLGKATARHHNLAAEVDRLRQSSDKSSKATALLSKKQNELKNSQTAVTKATAEQRSAISQINSIYGKYLGYLLTERNYALLAASAHDKITAAIEREMLVKQQQASIDAVDSKYQSDISEDYGKQSDKLVRMGKLSRSQASSTMGAMQAWLRANILYSNGKSYVDPSAIRQLSRGGLDLTGASPQQVAAVWLNNYLKNRFHMDMYTRNHISGIHIKKKDNGRGYTYQSVGTLDNNLRADYADTYVKRAEEEGAVKEVYGADYNIATRKVHSASIRTLQGLILDAKRARRIIFNPKASKAAKSQAYGDLANALEGLNNNAQNLDPRRDAKSLSQIRGFVASFRKDGRIDKNRLAKAQENAHNAINDLETGNNNFDAYSDNGSNTGTGGESLNTSKFDPGEDKNPWGSHPDASSTNWSKYNADELVQRRKQMNDFVRALQGDTDVESVLSQDPALMKAVKSGKVKNDADSVIEWYNKQRLEIQNVLHGRHLTNTGGWQDPKKSHQRAKSIAKQAKDDMAYYLDELDAYYTEQKSRIEDAQNDGQITEEEGWRRTLQNEQIWRQRRAELQQLYTDKNKEVTKGEKDSIYDIISERTGDTTSFISANIQSTRGMIEKVGEKSLPAMRKIYGDLDKGVEQDFLKMRTALKKQLDAIEEIVSKERPFDGIVKNLRQNVEKMGLLFTDLDNKRMKLLAEGKDNGSKEMKALDVQYFDQLNPRLTFLLKESENAYQVTWKQFEKDLRANGFGDWADAILNSENAEKSKEAVIAQLHEVYDSVQDAIKKEASIVKKQAEVTWNDTTLPGNQSMKQLYEKAAAAMGLEASSAQRANQLINAGPASERVADKLAIKQMEIQLEMQEHYYALVRKTGQQRYDDLIRRANQLQEEGKLQEAENKRLDAKHVQMSMNLTVAEEETDLAKQRADIIAKAQESENRLYTSLREWGTLLSNSLKTVFEASNTGAADYYNNLAKMRLTGEGSAGGTYVIIDNAGTSKAAAHYESLDGEDALKRQLEVEQQNAVADAWKKVMDDINNKINEQITDWINAAFQNSAMDANTAALEANTAALYATRPQPSGSPAATPTSAKPLPMEPIIIPENVDKMESPQYNENDSTTWPRALRKRMGMTVDQNDRIPGPVENQPKQEAQWPAMEGQGGWSDTDQRWNVGTAPTTDQVQAELEETKNLYEMKTEYQQQYTDSVLANNKKINTSTSQTNKKDQTDTRSAFAQMSLAANMYGIAYQAMSNDNMTTTQKFLSFAVQAAGQAAIAMLTTDLSGSQAQMATDMPGIYGKIMKQLGVPAGPIVIAGITAVLGGLMGLAVSKVSKSKSQIAQATGASVSAGRLSTGMLTYATGNVNEFTDPSTLTPGQQYNVDAADGHTYRARYMGSNPTTHLTNGPEFHLVGERGREAIIDANTTRQLQMNDTGIWQAIQTLYNGGSIRAVRRNRSGMANFAEGNINDFAEAASQGSGNSANMDMLAALQQSLDRNSEVMEKAVKNGIKGVFDVYGKDGLIDSYDKGKKNVNRHGERY